MTYKTCNRSCISVFKGKNPCKIWLSLLYCREKLFLRNIFGGIVKDFMSLCKCIYSLSFHIAGVGKLCCKLNYNFKVKIKPVDFLVLYAYIEAVKGKIICIYLSQISRKGITAVIIVTCIIFDGNICFFPCLSIFLNKSAVMVTV